VCIQDFFHADLLANYILIIEIVFLGPCNKLVSYNYLQLNKYILFFYTFAKVQMFIYHSILCRQFNFIIFSSTFLYRVKTNITFRAFLYFIHLLLQNILCDLVDLCGNIVG